MKKEIFNGRYVIYSDGRIWSVKRNKFLKPSFHHTGYTRVCIDKKDYRIHVLVAKSFIPNPNNFTDINHINKIKSDNRVENLEWCTHRYNSIYSISNETPGVYFYKEKYNVRIYHNKKNLYLGRFSTIEEAIKVRDEYIRLHNL